MRIMKNNGLTVIEFLIVIIIIGILLSVVVAKGRVAANNVRLGQALQQGSEIAGYLVTWAQSQAEADPDSGPHKYGDFFLGEIGRQEADMASRSLVDRYTGNENFDGVEKMIAGDRPPQNPFNNASYFDPRNDDPKNIPSSRPGLLYLASVINDQAGGGDGRNYRYFYLLVTGLDGGWYNEADLRGHEAMRRGIFVAQTTE